MALGERNHVRVNHILPWMRAYAFVDAAEHLADGLFIAREVPVRFRRKEYGHPDSPYVVAFCSFNKRYEKNFIKCMADLERRILMAGFKGYGDACEKAFNAVEGTVL